jgi:shikimate kinase
VRRFQGYALGKFVDAMPARKASRLESQNILSSEPNIVLELVQNGAIAASVSGNGPSIAAITKNENEDKIKKILAKSNGSVIVSKINNRKAEVIEL